MRRWLFVLSLASMGVMPLMSLCSKPDGSSHPQQLQPPADMRLLTSAYSVDGSDPCEIVELAERMGLSAFAPDVNGINAAARAMGEEGITPHDCPGPDR